MRANTLNVLEDVPIRQNRSMLAGFVSRLLHVSKTERRRVLHTLMRRIELHNDKLEVKAPVPALYEQIGGTAPPEDGSNGVELPLTIPISTVRAGGATRSAR